MSAVSYKEDFLKHIRWNLIRSIAAAEKMDYIFSGETCTFLATQVLTSMVLGRGSQVAEETAFYDDNRGIPVLRPLREFQSKEIVMYNQLHGLTFFVHPTLTTKMSPCTSLNQVTETFVVELQRDYPATVSTIFRTGDKLSSTYSAANHKCVICNASVDTDHPDSSAISALKLSEDISKLKVQDKENSRNCCENLCDSCTVTDTSFNLDFKHLCFGCQKIVKNMKLKTSLPPDMLHQMQVLHNRQKMKDVIKDCLIEEECD